MIKGFFINLDERKDRLEHFNNLMGKCTLFSNLERFSAVKLKNGAAGCGMSHIKVLQKCLEMKEEYFLISEDDIVILNLDNYIEFVNNFSKIKNSDDWDIIVLTPRGDMIKEENKTMNSVNFYRINNNQTTTAYIIKKRFINTLIDNFKTSVDGLLKDLNPDVFSIDQYWKRLQNKYNFYYNKNIFAGQLPGYSSIENKIVNYNTRFIEQK